MYQHSIFPACRLQLSKTKQNAKTVPVRLAFPINAHQNANQKPIGSVTGAVYTSTPANLPDPPFRFFEGLVPRLGRGRVSL